MGWLAEHRSWEADFSVLICQNAACGHFDGLPTTRPGVSRETYSWLMRPLRYSINVTLDLCCDHRALLLNEDLHRHAV